MGQACSVLCSKDVAPAGNSTAVVAENPKCGPHDQPSTGSKTGATESENADLALKDNRRKRLSVTHADPVATDEIKVGPSYNNGEADVLEQLRQATILQHLHEDEKRLNRRGIVISAALDKRTKKNFEEKDLAVEGGNSPAEVQKELLSTGIGIVCKKGKKPDAPNQDAFAVVTLENKFQLFCVFDGHGPAGHNVSNFVRETIPKLFLQHELRETDPKKAFEDAFVRCQQLLAHLSRARIVECEMSGSTCTVAYHDIPNARLTIAHVGDSRAVLCKFSSDDAIVLNETEDHKPNLPAEKKMIEKAGGKVVFDGFYNHRVFTTDGRGGLNMSRALGDCIAHQAGVSAIPEVMSISLDSLRSNMGNGEKLSLLVCSDGVWEFIESKDAAMYVAKHDLQAAAETLAVRSRDLWLKDSQGEVTDDITAIIAYL